ncbi:polyketide synthase [Fusarium albosuccineum]|uniref:Polyketide synthase n=1 Tax=Fusarium albosuccineum TaxID=1237068 RepID=A0A8H4PD53_9HYPO|nr:polyketide synthase [Fusarium albosuccineum]
MLNLETVVFNESQQLADKGRAQNNTLHIDWERDADFFSGHSANQTPPLCDTVVDHQLVLARAAALLIRACINNMSNQDATVNPISLSGHRLQLYKWMEAYNYSQASKILLEDVSMTSAIDILSSFPQLGVVGELLSQIGPNLIAILSGTLDPIPLLLDADRLMQIWGSIETMRRMQAHVRGYLSSYAIKRPRMSLLEIGASTCNTTDTIIKAFQGRNLRSHDLTDASLPTLKQVKRLFEHRDGVYFKSLDINKDPLSQGFVAGDYDVVVINNALHIANSLDEVVKKARQLLVPGGALIILGMTDVSPAYGLISGMIESTWSGIRADQLPLPSPTEWTRILAENGFGGLEPATRNFDKIGQTCYCVISTALASPRKQMPMNIITDTKGELVKFAGQLSATLATNGTASTISDFKLSTTSHDSIHVIIDEGSNPVLTDPIRFAVIKELALNATHILWVSMRWDGANAASESDMDMATRFTRVARKENESLKLVSLLVKQEHPSLPEILQVIMRILEISFQQDRAPHCELEYEYKNGQVFVPRIASV